MRDDLRRRLPICRIFGPVPLISPLSSFILLAFTLLSLVQAMPARADALERLRPERLEAVRKAVIALRSERREIPRTGPYQAWRAAIHVHSSLSHDSRGTIEQIVAAARTTRTRIVMFAEHASDRHDFFTDGHRGVREGVLLIPGGETRGFLVFPRQRLEVPPSVAPQQFADHVRGAGGLVFLSHLEERMDWQIRGLTGVEIYNTHADFKDEKNLIAALRNPLWLMSSGDVFHTYPQEAFAAVQDHPADYLRRWDELCQAAPHTGVAANDSHQNVGLVVRVGEGDKVRIEDAAGKKLLEVDLGLVPLMASLRKRKQPGETLYQVQLDPYESSFRHVGTYLLMAELSEDAVWEALQAGRAYVAFDWMADAAGFDFAAVSPSRRYEMGSLLTFEPGLKLRAQAPLPAQWKLLRSGKPVASAAGRTLEVAVTGPGNYRVEASLQIADEPRTWIVSNPVYVRATP